MKVTVCQLDNRAAMLAAGLSALAEHVAQAGSDLLLLPEMCFAEWLAADPEPDQARWRSAVDDHLRHLEGLCHLGVPVIIGTRPVGETAETRQNRAWLWRTGEDLQDVHAKTYLPDEAGYWEASWYRRGPVEFEACAAHGVRIGVQICTEMWFFEWARKFARDGVDLLCIPRATPHASTGKWLAGGQAAAVCAGAWCLSSNLWNPPGSRADCGGLGWIISPEGDVLATTSEHEPCVTRDIDIEFARASKQTYPRYVLE
ncbi:MAG: carbon-nitrogen hydrolase family protein [Gammaproteobacteria bacterium]|nr:carbon-nitrogen hydrolase family protein [Gammaproteobacteria bacterium]